ncbi:nucleotide-binding protein [Polaromonas hydrogenivorans]|uniref:Nucleotide-binding protein n=1 Tax=Polaromonas hydrogenivorans TaxID=335476 RepID=A0AAU7LQJ1_9BURK
MIFEKIAKESIKLEKFATYDCSNLTIISNEAEKVGRAWSGSWLGYHSHVYYRNLEIPPAGARFSSEWGLNNKVESLGLGSVGEWIEFSFKDITEYIQNKTGNLNLSKVSHDSFAAAEQIEDVKSTVLSILHAQSILENDKFLQKLANKLEEIKPPSREDFIKNETPKGQLSTRDNRVECKIIPPPHILIKCNAYATMAPFIAAKNLKKIIEQIASHLDNLESKMESTKRIGTNIFIGHGRSSDWRDLKDFINERLGLPWDEFNRVPVAGLTNITRLAQMLDQACIAFLVMSAEDEQIDGNKHARQNVIHEVGLFQGRLGFERAIVLLEEGCEEFSNIQGLGQIRYPKGNIGAIFEDIRQVLEREDIL